MESLHHTLRSSWVRVMGIGAIALAALTGVVLLQQSRLNRPAALENLEQAVQQEKIQLDLLKRSPTFGFNNLVGNWVFLNFLEYYGDAPAREKTGYALSADYFDVITQLDPRFTNIYMFLSGSISYQLGQPKLAIDLMKRGTQTLSPEINPLAFQVWRLMSLDQLLLLGDIPGAINSLTKAADWTRGTPYADLEPNFRQTARFLRTDPNSKPIRVSAWGSIYQQAVAINDKQTQARAKREILALGGKVFEKDGKLYVQPPLEREKREGEREKNEE